MLDLFCGAGGAGMGYHRAGFDVVGVDIKPQPRYPFTFVQGDALEYCRAHGREYDVIHASPPCQGYSRMRHLPWLAGREYPLLIDATRAALRDVGTEWIIENVADAPLAGGTLCGAAIGLAGVSRHRRFEASVLLLFPSCPGHATLAHGRATMGVKYRGHGVTGVARGARAEDALGIDWMTRSELAQAIPPAYTEWIGHRMLEAMQWEA